MTVRLEQRDYSGRPDLRARGLLNCTLVRVTDDGVRLAGRIVETEAYCGPEDQCAHSRNGHRSPRNEVMYGKPGLAYVYFTYGMHHCMNVVCGEVDQPVAVLIRAIEPTEGVERIMANRAGTKPRKSPLRVRDLCSGPARLCQAFEIDRKLNGLDLTTDKRMWIKPRESAPDKIVNTTRVGVGETGEWVEAPLRWYIADCAHISRR